MSTQGYSQPVPSPHDFSSSDLSTELKLLRFPSCSNHKDRAGVILPWRVAQASLGCKGLNQGIHARGLGSMRSCFRHVSSHQSPSEQGHWVKH